MMKSIVATIARRELNSFFDSLTAYILLIAFLGFSGFFTWIYGSDVFMRKEADLDVFFGIAKWTLFFFIPAVTMKMLAEEKKTGTLEILLTKAVNPRQLILGKYLACLMLIMIALAFTLPYYISVARIGDIDHGATLSGYLGLMLMSSAYIAIGLFASSITNNQIVAFLLALLIGIVFHFILDVISSGMRGWAGNLLSDLSVGKHFDSMSRGVIDTKDILFFAGLTLLGLFLSETFISKNK
ncbi:MAG: ABC transporter permease subunit [Saprospiraceae bacterium]|nr:ABC transporter permease subunit [Saprospiraceae bacterium]HMW39686.1 ABC transporter permease subunit [Saprospiraceae bacterium]HMX88829.1 ABC transporter permease subunit [Saprospiraceae bacterium]HMZ39307.1 ABC transporter permease subunit [Saprospiraceae bacterium]HNB31943.1 ABC transporter permease subunit [Saprospiraceae bacterium]